MTDPTAFGRAVHAAHRGDAAALDSVLDELLALATAPVEAQWAALHALVRRPRLVTRLDQRMRTTVYVRAPDRDTAPGVDHWTALPSRADDPRVRAAASPRNVAGPPAAVVLAAMARSGRMREDAVAAMAARPAPELLPFLALRCGDWVGKVREPARAAVARLLGDDPVATLDAVLPIAGYTARRERGGWVLRQVRAAVAAAFDRLGRELIRSRHADARRLAYEIGTERNRWSQDDLVGFALHEPDPVIRSRSAAAACAEAGHRGDVPVLRALARARFSQVRVLALVELARLGRDAEVAEAITDPAPLVRAYARSRTGEAAQRYRSLVAAAPTPAAVAGLGEVGGYADQALLEPLLADGDARIRAAAVRALAALDCVPVAAVLPLLRDPSASVVRAAADAVRPYRRLVPPDVPWQLLTDPRPHVRRGAYHLLGGRDRGTRLRAALLLAADADPALARRGRADVQRLTASGAWAAEPPAADPGELLRSAVPLGAAVVERVRRASAE